MSDESTRPIIVKRVKKNAHGHHGGAWKIAYADFVTAMMAFFLLMWLLSSVSKSDLQGIAEYFQQPLRVAMLGGNSVGASSSILQGGGRDLTKTQGQVRAGEIKRLDPKALKDEFERMEKQRLEDLKSKLMAQIDANPTLRQFKNQLLIDITTEGLRIQIVDEKNRPMFDLSSAELKPYTREILHEIGRTLNGVPNKINISGHTDATQYAGGDKGFSNWELSSTRANAARRELVGGGMEEGKVIRVVGLASTIPLDKKDANNPINRRISIIVMNKRTEEALLQAGEEPPKPASDEPISASVNH